jgi:uncharacterized membrane protein YfcA
MTPEFFLFLAGAGAAVGFFSGLLGIGGGILMFPLLHYLPQALGFDPIGVKNITGLTMVQGFFASLSAMLFYKKQGFVNRDLVLSLGLSLFASSLIGSFLSKTVPDNVLLFIFGMLALIAAALMFIPRNYRQDDLTEEHVNFNRPAAVMIGIIVGLLVGLVGQGGAFITIPLMLYVMKIPLRVALGSTLAIGLFSATAGTIGKVATGQVPYLMAVPLLVGAIPVAKAGAWLSKRTKTEYLRWLLALIISGTAIKIWMDIFR